MDDLTAYNLTKQARAAAYAGDREEALSLFRQAIAIQPDDKQALKGLAALTDDPAEKRRAIEQVLTLDPFDEEARSALDYAMSAVESDERAELFAWGGLGEVENTISAIEEFLENPRFRDSDQQ